MKLKFYLLFSAILQLGNIYPIIVSLNLFQKDKKRIFVMGDCHKDDRTQNRIVFDWIRGLTDPIIFLLEEVNYKVDNNYKGICGGLYSWIVKKNFKHNNVHFVFADNRTRNFNRIANLHIAFAETLNKYFKDKQPSAREKSDMQQSAVKNFGDCTIEELLTEIDTLVDELGNRHQESVASVTLNPLFVKFYSQYQAFKDFFEKYDKQASVVDTILEAKISDNKHFEESFWPTYMGVMTNIADIGFIFALEDSLSKCDNVVLYVGHAHVANIFTYLENDFDKVSSAGLKPSDLKNLESMKFEPAELEKLLKTGFKSELKSDNKDFMCANGQCANIADQVCSRCKAAHYCSRECQKKDWKKHKLYCLPEVAAANSGKQEGK